MKKDIEKAPPSVTHPGNDLDASMGRDPIPRLMVRFALPSVLCLVVNAFYNIVDQVFVSRGVGYLGNGATNVVYPLMVFVIAIGSLLGDGCAAYFSLQLGKGEKEKGLTSAGNTLLFIFVSGILLGVLSFVFIEPICRLLGATDQDLALATEYGRIIAIGFPFSVIDVAFSSVVRADGSPVYSMVGLLIGCAANLTLDPILILGCGLGMKGAAIATIVGEILNTIFILVYIPRFRTGRLRKQHYRIQGAVMKKVLGLGVSSFIIQLSTVLLVSVSNNLLVKYGAMSLYGADIPLAAVGVTFKLNQVVVSIIQGLGTGTQPVLGYNYGAHNFQRTKQAFRIMVITSTVVMVIAFLAFQLFPGAIVSIFGSRSELYDAFAVKCLRIYLMLCFLNGLQMCVSYFFQAVGKPVIASVNTLLKQLLLIIPAMLILTALLGVEGVLWAGPVADGLAFLAALLLLRGNWKKTFPSDAVMGPV